MSTALLIETQNTIVLKNRKHGLPNSHRPTCQAARRRWMNAVILKIGFSFQGFIERD
ncbi:uncharacterized protein CELE_Y66H1A.8 [Caenorhabditis elegans]|uniref:Uncharacterized protein n=2 Tax=Caenorhabditis elegans TaxID=6239 RepID=U4PMQ4_CAEEL|nr:Uncharacterized protein CELE_Y66H1A.8 [Caenorhabditis elegans]CDH93379.1 Uncharacterized protein CELE_Y66H1A.8 [Caenorhabditis elegans]|eukprot:NP_001294576.1 Uncharacterized protein CELE_Y66H1A.8 [Caenorhabditis elegans]